MSSQGRPDAESFLLEDLTETERQQFEERALLDDGFFEQLTVAESELIDRSVRGELSPRAEARLARRWEDNPRIARRRAFAAALHRAIGRPEGPTAQGTPTASSNQPASRSWWALAASLLLVVGLAGGLGFSLGAREVAETRADLNQAFETRLSKLEAVTETDQRALGAALEALRSKDQRIASLEGESSRLEEQIDQLRQAAGTQPPAPKASSLRTTGRTAVLLLGLGGTRSGDGASARTLQPDVEIVRLQLSLEGDVDYESFAVSIQGAGGETIWAQDSMTLTDLDWASVVEVELDRSELPAGHYQVSLVGQRSGQAPRDVGFYQLSLAD